MRFRLCFLALVAGALTVPVQSPAAAEPPPVPLVYEARENETARDDQGRQLAEAVAAGLVDEVVATAMPTTRVNALMDSAAPVCVVLHGRSPARESRRRWVEELARNRTFLVALSPGHDQPGPTDSIIALAASPYEVMAREISGRVEAVKSRALLFQMAQARRAAYWVEDEGVLNWVRDQRLLTDLRIVRELPPVTGWLACSLSVPDDLVQRLATQVQALREDGTLARILRQDVGPAGVRPS